MSDAHRRLVRALVQRSGGTATLLAGEAVDWASVTFAGQRHRIALAVPAEDARRLADGLEEHEFALPGHLVADIAVVARRHGPTTEVEIEALTIVDASPPARVQQGSCARWSPGLPGAPPEALDSGVRRSTAHPRNEALPRHV